MARPQHYGDEDLLDAARDVFLELGPSAASRVLAERAGVSEGTLFKRFGTKRELFLRSMRISPVENRGWFTRMLDRAGKGSLGVHLYEIASGLQAHVREAFPMAQMACALGDLTKAELALVFGPGEPLPLKVRGRLRELFAAEMEASRIRRCDPEILARLFAGAVVSDAHHREFFFELSEPTESSERFISRLVESFLELTIPDPS